MKKKLLISLFLISLLFTLPSTTVLAEGGNTEPRLSEEYPDNRYDLMTHADDSWYQWAQKTGTAAIAGIKNFLWNFNVIIANITQMIVYQLFSLDVVDLTKDSIMAIASGTAGSLLANLGTFALAIASLGIVIRAYIKQDWQAFFKILTLVVISMALLFSIQTQAFNYVNLAQGLSVNIENAIMNVNPSLTNTQNFEVDADGNIDEQVSVQVENKVFESLLYKPYLLLQYGTTNEDTINQEDSYNGELSRIDEYLSANPATEDGQELREDIAAYEMETLNNESIFAGNGFHTSAYIMGIILSTVIQGIVFFFLALMRIMLQFAFLFILILLPFMLFMSIFPTFEGLVMRYTQGLFMLIIFKAITVFFVLVATSFITLSYEMVDLSDDIYYRIFIQSIFAIAIIFMYMKRSFVMDMLQGAAPNLSNTGTSEGMGRRRLAGFQGGASKGKIGLQKTGSGIKKAGSGVKSGIAKTAGITAIAGKKASDSTKNARGKIGAQMDKAKDYVGKVQNGEIPNQKESPYHTNEAASTTEQDSTGNVKTANFGNSSYKTQSSNQLNNQNKNANIQGENVNVNSSNKRNPRNVTPIRANANQKSNQSKGTTNARKPKPLKDNANKVNNPGSGLSNDKPITQWEAQQQVKQKDNFTNKQTSRNPYQHINENNQSNLRKQNIKQSNNHKDGMLNKRSLLHGNKKE